MLRPILATAIFGIVIGGGVLAVCFAAYEEELSPTGQRLMLVSILALVWVSAPLGAAYGVVAFEPPGNRLQKWWRVVADVTCFFTLIGLFCIAVNLFLRPVVGETTSTFVYFGVTFVCLHLCLKRIQRPPN